MQAFITIANTNEDLMKYVFVGIFIFLALIVNGLKALGLKNKKEQENSANSSEDMANARRRLQEMMRDANARQNPNFPQAPKPFSPYGEFEEADEDESYGEFDRAEEQGFGGFDKEFEAKRKSRQDDFKPIFDRRLKPSPRTANAHNTTSASANSSDAYGSANSESKAYEQNTFDYNAELEASEKLLAQSQISYKKATKTKAQAASVCESEIKLSEISDFVHNKEMLKKSIIISEILDKPLSLR